MSDIFDIKEYRRMFHPKLPEICLHVTTHQRVSDYELQRVFRVSKDDLIYVLVAMSHMGILVLDPVGSEHVVLISGVNDLSFFEDKVIQFVGAATSYFESALRDEMMAMKIAETEPEENDPLLKQAVSFIAKTKKTSISSVQRNFRIGYNRAAQIIETLELEGIVSPPGINGNREVMVGEDYEYEEKSSDSTIPTNVIPFRK